MQIKRGSKRSLHWEETLWTFAAAGRRPIAPFIKWLREREGSSSGTIGHCCNAFCKPGRSQTPFLKVSLSLLWHCRQLLNCLRCLLVCMNGALVLRNKKQLMRILDISCSALVGDFKYKLHRFLCRGLMFHGKYQSERYKETQQAGLLVLKGET